MLEEEKVIKLYRELNRELYIYIFRFTGSRESSEDILHDCFLNLINYSKKKEIRHDTTRAFLYRTAHNLCVNYLKKKNRIKFSPIENDEPLANQDSAEKNLEFEELNLKIYQLIQKLDEISRSLFIMKKELNLSLGEIAENTGLSERTVRRKISRVLDYLKEELKNSGFI